MHAQNDRWGLGPIETSYSGANHAVLQAQNDSWGVGPMETSYSGANHAVLHAQSDRWGLGTIETINSGHVSLLWMHKTTDEGWDT